MARSDTRSIPRGTFAPPGNFINRPGNAQRYTAAQLEQIKARIIAAWKENINSDGPPFGR
jgi:hypothetical protein